MIWARVAMAWAGVAVHGKASVSVHCRPMVDELQVIEDEMDTWLDLLRRNFDQGTGLALVHLRSNCHYVKPGCYPILILVLALSPQAFETGSR